ncbi:hypothetical protein FHW37_104483 [Neorhizobium alkalisoli]|uniref:Probable membrane transporter protein n=1 Tax=Neorhizobium alkalisoli TaxID=528178 RepID=A0A561QS44_9HYPH|nr:hypothetical protein FHW37_104483 [Neorhizobium alkalisoli]
MTVGILQALFIWHVGLLFMILPGRIPIISDRPCHAVLPVRIRPVTVYLPIAELSVNILIILGMGAAVGFLSGMFGVGGGFLITPLLIFYNIPPVVAVATGANQVVASSISGAITHFRRGTVDVKLGSILLAGGLVGATGGVWIFSWLRRLGQLDLFISILYVVLLGSIGALMLQESVRAMRRAKTNQALPIKRPGQHNWVHRLPLKMRFKKSKIYLSAIPVVMLGMAIGVLTSIMGVGGGFIMVPAMIYLLRIPTNVVVGTSLFQIIFTTAYTTMVQAATNYSVDIVLATILMIAGVIGAQYGVRVGQKLRGEQLRALLALLVLAVGIRLAIGLIVTPDDLYSVAVGGLSY